MNQWNKSTHSGLSECVEVQWHKSTHSGDSSCVETATLPAGGVLVRNSRHPDQTVLQFTPGEWKAFVAGVKDGEFDG